MLDATIDLVLRWHLPPTAEQVAEEAGVSIASIFRYFENLDDLRRAAITRFIERHLHLLELPDLGEHSLQRRIASLVDGRVRFYELVEPVARIARARFLDVPALATTLDLVRSTQSDQLAEHFATELRCHRAPVRRERLALVAVVTSFEAWDLLRREGLDRDGVCRAMRTSVARLL